MLDFDRAKLILRVDGDYNDGLIFSLLTAIPNYIEEVTGMSQDDQASDPVVETVSGFILRLWYYADHADDAKLQRTIDSLLKVITLKADKIARDAAAVE